MPNSTVPVFSGSSGFLPASAGFCRTVWGPCCFGGALGAVAVSIRAVFRRLHRRPCFVPVLPDAILRLVRLGSRLSGSLCPGFGEAAFYLPASPVFWAARFFRLIPLFACFSRSFRFPGCRFYSPGFSHLFVFLLSVRPPVFCLTLPSRQPLSSPRNSASRMKNPGFLVGKPGS